MDFNSQYKETMEKSMLQGLQAASHPQLETEKGECKYKAVYFIFSI